MGKKNKLQRYFDNKSFPNVLEHTEISGENSTAGRWAEDLFGNQHPIVVELACGKGEYTTSMARLFPNKNFIGIDIKGDRIWKGAKRADEEGLTNVRFLRCYIDHLDQFFGPNEISEIWITFPDPYLKKSSAKKRLTSPKFLSIYRRVSDKKCLVNLKTDSPKLFEFTCEVVEDQGLKIHQHFDNLYEQYSGDEILSIKTYYEQMHLGEGRTIHFISFSLFN